MTLNKAFHWNETLTLQDSCIWS